MLAGLIERNVLDALVAQLQREGHATRSRWRWPCCAYGRLPCTRGSKSATALVTPPARRFRLLGSQERLTASMASGDAAVLHVDVEASATDSLVKPSVFRRLLCRLRSSDRTRRDAESPAPRDRAETSNATRHGSTSLCFAPGILRLSPKASIVCHAACSACVRGRAWIDEGTADEAGMLVRDGVQHFLHGPVSFTGETDDAPGETGAVEVAGGHCVAVAFNGGRELKWRSSGLAPAAR